MGSAAKQLNGKLSLFKSVARGATWYVPATLGIISVASAAPEMRMRTLLVFQFYRPTAIFKLSKCSRADWKITYSSNWLALTSPLKAGKLPLRSSSSSLSVAT